MALCTRLDFKRYGKRACRVSHADAIAKFHGRVAQSKNAVWEVEQFFPRALIVKGHILQQPCGKAHRLAVSAWAACEELKLVARIISMLQKELGKCRMRLRLPCGCKAGL